MPPRLGSYTIIDRQDWEMDFYESKLFQCMNRLKNLMEDELIRLFEEIEKEGLKTGIGKIQLKNKLKQSDAPLAPDLSEKLIKEAHKRGLIRDATGQSKPEESSDRDDMVCVLTIAGFELLNQIRMRKATELIANSSKRLERMTTVLIALTIVLIVLTAVLAGDILMRYFIK